MSEATRTVLVVEDNEIEREGLAFVLRRAGYAVIPLGNGREAIGYLRPCPAPALILLDMMMPVLDGWRFLEELRRLPRPPAAPVLVVTGNPSIGPEWAQAHGCAGFLKKPFDTEALLAEVCRCLGEAPPAAPEAPARA